MFKLFTIAALALIYALGLPPEAVVGLFRPSLSEIAGVVLLALIIVATVKMAAKETHRERTR